MSSHTIDVIVDGLKLEVEFDYIRGFTGSYWEPPEPDEFDITMIRDDSRLAYLDLAEILNEQQDESKHPIVLAIIAHMDGVFAAEAAAEAAHFAQVKDMTE